MQKKKDTFDVIQIRLVGMAASSFFVYFWLLDKLKDGLGIYYQLAQQIVAACMVILVIASGWKFVELVVKARGTAGDKIRGFMTKEEDDKLEEPKED